MLLRVLCVLRGRFLSIFDISFSRCDETFPQDVGSRLSGRRNLSDLWWFEGLKLGVGIGNMRGRERGGMGLMEWSRGRRNGPQKTCEKHLTGPVRSDIIQGCPRMGTRAF